MSDEQSQAAPVAFDDAILADDSEFLGVIVVDESVNGTYGPQWHYAIKPVDFTLGGKTGAYHEYVPADKLTMRSKFGKALSAFVLVFGKGQFKQVGAGEMIGQAAIWKRVRTDFGKDRQTKEQISVEQVLPFRLATAEERARASSVGTTVDAPTAAPAQFSDEQREAIIKVVAGATPQEAIIAVAKSRLAPDLKGAIVNGTALPALVEGGFLVMNGEGKYVVPEPVAVS